MGSENKDKQDEGETFVERQCVFVSSKDRNPAGQLIVP